MIKMVVRAATSGKKGVLRTFLFILCVVLAAAVLIYCFIVQRPADNTFDLPDARKILYSLVVEDSTGKPLANKKIRVRQLRQEFLIYNSDFFQNFIWMETSDEKFLSHNLKAQLTEDDVIKAFKLDRIAAEKKLDMYLDLRIPVSTTENLTLEEYAAVEFKALETYGRAFKKAGVSPDYVHVLNEFNQKMVIRLKFFDIDKNMDFVVKYLAKTRELFPKAKISIDLGGLEYIEENEKIPNGPNTIHEVKIGLAPTHIKFIELLNERNASYDILGMEYQAAILWPYDFDTFKEFMGRIESFGKPIFLWEYWVPTSADLHKSHPFFGIIDYFLPPGGLSEEYQADFIEKTLEHINNNSLYVGLNQFGYKDGVEGNPSSEYDGGLLRADGSKKSAYFIMEKWYKSWFAEYDLVTDASGKIEFYGLPGRYRLSKGPFNKVEIELTAQENEVRVTM